MHKNIIVNGRKKSNLASMKTFFSKFKEGIKKSVVQKSSILCQPNPLDQHK